MADTIARWHRLRGENTFFLTGTDENSIKTIQGARKFGYGDIQKYTDMMANKWKETWKSLGISNDDFIRTTEDRHRKTVERFYLRCLKKGDIYKGKYEGLYCEGCEAFLTEKDLVNGLCPDHKKPPKRISEENYFFKLSRYSKKILDHIKKHPRFIMPKTRRNEVISFIKSGLQDISISRPDQEWGIPLPNDKKHVFWVWFDALVNYISAGEKFWPPDLQLMAKDILKFHAVIWPAMLMSAGYELPKRIFAHGFFTINGEKMSKSLGNVVDPVKLSKKYPLDSIRYFLMRSVPLGEDGDFSENSLKERHNNELVNDLGNLLSRITVMIKKYFDSKIPDGKIDDALSKNLDFQKIHEYMEKLELHHALDTIWEFIRACNRYINDKKPWERGCENRKDIIYTLADSIRVISILLSPFMPETSASINKQLGIKQEYLENAKFGLLKPGKIGKPSHLFEKIR